MWIPFLFLKFIHLKKKKKNIISNICVLSFLLPLSELKQESLGNRLGMSDPENSTAPHEINSLFPVLWFDNQHSNTRSALEKHTLTSKRTPNVFGLSKKGSDEGICSANNEDILDTADETSHECAIERMISKQKQHFTRHECTKVVEKKYKCSVGGKKSTKHNGPIEGKHFEAGEKPYQYSQYRTKNSEHSVFVTHKRIKNGYRPFECTECGRKFATYSNLSGHRRIHSAEKPYDCSECGKKFCQHCIPIRYKRVHTEEKPYERSECGKQFSQQSNLAKHKRVHSREKPYECSECGKKFSQKSVLITHKRIHTGEKPYECSECGKKFSQQCNLIKHKRIHI